MIALLIFLGTAWWATSSFWFGVGLTFLATMLFGD